MNLKRLLISSAMLAALVPAGLGHAANRFCNQEGDIGALSDLVLKNRAGLSKFKSRDQGTLSAYLKIRYQNLDNASAETILSTLAEGRVRRIDELRPAWYVTQYGMDGAMQKLAGDTSKELQNYSFSPSVLRALALTEKPEAFVKRLSDLPEKERLSAEHKAVVAVLDQSDSFKAAFAKVAADHSLNLMASGLAATQIDSKAWDAFAVTIKDPDALEALAAHWRWAPGLMGNPSLPRQVPGTVDQIAMRNKFDFVLRGSARIPELDFLMTYLNQSGDVDQTLKAVQAVEAEDDTPEQPITMDRAWLQAYKALLAASESAEKVDSNLRSFTIGGQRHYGSGKARDMLDWMIAVDALKPYLAGRSANVAVPERLSPEFAYDWPLWVKAAEAIVNSRDLAPLAADEKTRAITTELLYAAGRSHDVALFLMTAPADSKTVELAEDFAVRMDRNCGKFLVSKAESVMNPTTPMFSFDR